MAITRMPLTTSITAALVVALVVALVALVGVLVVVGVVATVVYPLTTIWIVIARKTRARTETNYESPHHARPPTPTPTRHYPLVMFLPPRRPITTAPHLRVKWPPTG